MNADERRFIARAYIALVTMFLLAVPCKNQEASPQSAQSPKRAGGAGVREDGGRGSACPQATQCPFKALEIVGQ